MIIINVSFKWPNYFTSRTKFRYLSCYFLIFFFCFFCFRLPSWLTGAAKSIIWHILFLWIKIVLFFSTECVIRLHFKIKGNFVYLIFRDRYCYKHKSFALYGQVKIACTILRRSPSTYPQCCSHTSHSLDPDKWISWLFRECGNSTSLLDNF